MANKKGNISKEKSISEMVKEKNMEFQKEEKKITEEFNKAIGGLSLLL